tara:strand:- start:5966 stop:6142 length:177 start_codon:yes stop_codon:yes gene_type:complete
MRGASGSERRGERRIEREEKKIDDREMIDEREEKRDREIRLYIIIEYIYISYQEEEEE